MSEYGGAELLTEAGRILNEQGFSVASEVLEVIDRHWLLAENDLFILAIVPGSNLDDLCGVESYATAELLARIESKNAGSKRWDAYLVLMAQQGVDTDSAQQLMDLEYDTRGVRRLIATKTRPTPDNVRRALQAFMPLTRLVVGPDADAFEALEEQLRIHGVEADEARDMVAAFRSRGDLEHD